MAEILAPCGSFETLKVALRSGCDAVYLGGECFSARQNAENFSEGLLAKAVFECHKRGVKVYQAVNTVVFDEQTDKCMQTVETACRLGVDALITQDLLLPEIVKKCCPDMEIHASTQMTLHTKYGVIISKNLGFSRAVLSRELPADILKELSSLDIETEAFVHGALCMSVSGQCYMSAVIGSRSANRGLCAQACRLPVSAVRGRERYDLSLKDMSYLEDINKIVDSGVYSLKIEGRMKRPEYVGLSVDCCKKALNNEKFNSDDLRDVFSRGGFTDGYLYHKLGHDMFGVRKKEDVSATAKVLPKIHEIYRREEKRDKIDFYFYGKLGENCRLTVCDTHGNKAEISGDIPEQAVNKPTDYEFLKKQFSKLGDTIYEFNSLTADIDDNIRISPSVLNEMRREICNKLDNIRAKANTKTPKFVNADIMPTQYIHTNCKPKIRICVSKAEMLEDIDFDDIEYIALPLNELLKGNIPSSLTSKIMVRMPRFTFDENEQIQQLIKIKQLGITKMLASNIAHCLIAEEYGFELHTDFGFNLTNSVSLGAVKNLGAVDSVVSFELKHQQINNLKKPLPIGIFVYGRLPLMLTVNCPVSQAVGCKNCTGRLFDKTGREFPVKCSKKMGYVEVLNSEVLYLADKLDDFKNIDFIQLDFYDESAQDVKKIIDKYKHNKKSGTEKITRGLYYRGVL